MAELYNPIAAEVKITAGVNDVIDFDEGAGTLQATVAPGTYYLYGTATTTADSANLSEAIEAAMNAASALSYDVGVEFNLNPGAFPAVTAIANASLVAFEILGSSTFPIDVLGHPVGIDTGFAALLFSSVNCSRTWVSNQPGAIIDNGPFERNTIEHVTPQGQAYYFAANSTRDFRRMSFEYVESPRTFEDGTTKSFESLWRQINAGLKFRYFEIDPASTVFSNLDLSDLVSTYTLTSDSLTSFDPQRPVPQMNAYTFQLLAREVVV